MNQTLNNLKSYHKLVVFQKAKELVLLTYKITRRYPKEELFVLLPQMRRSAISIMANIVEGYVKSSRKEFGRFIDISIGSAAELQVYYELSVELEYITKDEFNKISDASSEVIRLLFGFRKGLKKDSKK